MWASAQMQDKHLNKCAKLKWFLLVCKSKSKHILFQYLQRFLLPVKHFLHPLERRWGCGDCLWWNGLDRGDNMVLVLGHHLYSWKLMRSISEQRSFLRLWLFRPAPALHIAGENKQVYVSPGSGGGGGGMLGAPKGRWTLEIHARWCTCSPVCFLSRCVPVFRCAFSERQSRTAVMIGRRCVFEWNTQFGR